MCFIYVFMKKKGDGTTMIATIQAYLTTNGNGQEAIKFYENALDAEVLSVQTFGDIYDNSESPLSEEMKNRIMNAQLAVGDTKLMISDTFSGEHEEDYQIGNHITLALIVNSIEKAKGVFEKLQEDGEVKMPLQETFWSPSYGQVVDKFGVIWQISTELNE